MNENGGKNGDGRNNKGRFKKGCKPGPGRGNVKENETELIPFSEMISQIQKDMRSKDYKIRHSAHKIYQQYKKMGGVFEDEPEITFLDPRLKKFREFIGDRMDDPDIQEVDDNILK